MGDTVIKCRFRHNIFEGADGFACYQYQEEDSRRNFRAVGHGLPNKPELTVILSGVWQSSPKYKEPSLKVSTFDVEMPQSEYGFVAYMRGLRVGIGKSVAQKIWERFGVSTWEILETEPERLLEIRGVSKLRLTALLDKLKETNAIRDLTRLFDGYLEVSQRKLHAILEKLGPAAAEVIKRCPHALCDVDGFGFDSVDALARALGVEADNEQRIQYAIRATLRSAASHGHMCLPVTELRKQTLTRLNRPYSPSAPVSAERYVAIAKRLSRADRDSISTVSGMVYLTFRLEQEKSIAENIMRLLSANADKGKSELRDNLDDFLVQYQQKTGVTYAEKQLEAIRTALHNNVSVITGGPGTGKTTVIKAVLAVHAALHEDSNPLLLAPTARAARRMTEQTGVDASTIHSALSLLGDDKDDRGMERLDANLVIVDEVSMLDSFVAHHLFDSIVSGSTVVLVGDSDQLPSVGAGNVLHEIIRSQQVPVVRLKVIYRQAETNPIIPNSAKIRKGKTDLIDAPTFRFVESSDATRILQKGCSLFVQAVRKRGLDNVILLNPYRNKGDVSAELFNRNLQHHLNPLKAGEEVVKSRGLEFRCGDKVMQLKNTRGPKNGDIGYIREVLYAPKSEGSTDLEIACKIDFGDETVIYRRSEMDQVDLAYCCTVHKAQGSEYPVVILIATNRHKNLLRRNLIYTGVTRAVDTVVVVGERAAFDAGVRDNTQQRRYTLLGDYLHAHGEAVKRLAVACE